MEQTYDIAVAACPSYDENEVAGALQTLLEATGGLDFVKPGMTIALKTNLVSGAAPEKAVCTHPAVLTALTKWLIDRGASVIIGDSPGGPFSPAVMKHVYKVSGLQTAEAAGAKLNENCAQTAASFPEGKIMKQITYTSWLSEADAVIGVCKLKTHGMMTYSGNVKNFFGAIPGTMKLEYHYRFPKHEDFADMLVDINEFLKPAFYITDAVVGMEGNGPTAGTPRQVGALLASKDPYALDEICARMIGLDPMTVPTIAAAKMRGLGAENPAIFGDWQAFAVPDYQKVTKMKDITFSGYIPKFLMPVVTKLLQARPQVKSSECIGCRKCHDICPARAISMTAEGKAGRPVIDRSQCIRCFCCQEFCPKGAMKVKRSALARFINLL
ncbi:MAG: DUF362 domain-containing protein [Lachnospiraceae bacterium]|nr:DUF362 domain-containing protein [Lachnospiraceae bacterium]